MTRLRVLGGWKFYVMNSIDLNSKICRSSPPPLMGMNLNNLKAGFWLIQIDLFFLDTSLCLLLSGRYNILSILYYFQKFVDAPPCRRGRRQRGRAPGPRHSQSSGAEEWCNTVTPEWQQVCQQRGQKCKCIAFMLRNIEKTSLELGQFNVYFYIKYLFRSIRY